MNTTAEPQVSSSPRSIAMRRFLLSGAAVALATTGLIFPFPMSGRLWSAIFDLAHAPVFCVLVLAIVGLLDPPAVGFSKRLTTLVSMTPQRTLAAAGLIMFLGIVCEYLQRFAGRSSDLHDVVANAVGILIALLWTRSVRTSGFRLLLRVMAFVILLGASLPPSLEIWDSVQQIRSFPVIASFERTWELAGWRPHDSSIEASGEWSVHGSRSMKVVMQPNQYSGVATMWLARDWTPFERLHLDLRNPGRSPLELIVRLNDRLHSQTGFRWEDRFHRTVVLPPESDVAVEIDLKDVAAAPADRTMDLSDMSLLDFYAVDVMEPTVWYIDHVRLE